MPRLVAVGTAVPPFSFEQKQIRETALHHFKTDLDNVERLLSIFDNVEVEKRHFCVPLEWFDRHHTFSEKNSEYIQWAERLSIEAIQDCLKKAQLCSNQVDHLVFVSTSGMSTPSIDARIMNRLEFNRHTKRTPIFGLGCAGGAAGLSHCLDLAKGAPDKRILLVTLELSSLTFQSENYEKSNFVASALFADGAGAGLICGDQCSENGVQMLDSLSTLWPGTLEVMGWEFSETGLQVIFSKSIPDLLKRHLYGSIEMFLKRNQINLQDLAHYVIHPGGAKVLGAFQELLKLLPSQLRHSRFILQNYGNMSSSTVLFILDRVLKHGAPQREEYGLCAAFGPGFSTELILLKW